MRVSAFEPEYSNLHLLRDNVIKNEVDGQVTIYPVALGAANGLSYLHVQDLNPGAALHTVSGDVLTKTRTERPVVAREGVVEMTLDAFCEQAGVAPTCMKIDVDGNETSVLEGAARTLSSPAFRSLLIEMPVEIAQHATCTARLERAGLRRDRLAQAGDSHNEVWIRP